MRPGFPGSNSGVGRGLSRPNPGWEREGGLGEGCGGRGRGCGPAGYLTAAEVRPPGPSPPTPALQRFGAEGQAWSPDEDCQPGCKDQHLFWLTSPPAALFLNHCNICPSGASWVCVSRVGTCAGISATYCAFNRVILQSLAMPQSPLLSNGGNNRASEDSMGSVCQVHAGVSAQRLAVTTASHSYVSVSECVCVCV